MSARPFDTVAARLAPYKPKETAPGRLRAICPVCGERNASTLSVGEGHDGAVLVTCFKSGCSIEAIAAALGLDVRDLFPPRQAPGGGHPPLQRRRLISPMQALQLLHDEVHLVLVAAADLAAGIALDDADHARLLQAVARIVVLRDEVMA
jgi:hypothetical protein